MCLALKHSTITIANLKPGSESDVVLSAAEFISWLDLTSRVFNEYEY